MATTEKPIDPFYVVRVRAGVAFGLTTLGYFIMAARATYDPVGSREEMDRASGLMAVMDRYGVKMMVVELIVLAEATVLALRVVTRLAFAVEQPRFVVQHVVENSSAGLP